MAIENESNQMVLFFNLFAPTQPGSKRLKKSVIHNH